MRKRWLARPRPLQTIQSPRTEAASFATWVFPLAMLAPSSSVHVFALGGNASFRLTNYGRIIGCPMSQLGHQLPRRLIATVSASLIGRLGSSAFRLSTVPVSMSLAGSRFSSESAQGPFHHGVRGRGGTIFTAALPSNRRQIQADTRTHLIHRPARDIIPPLGGARVPPIAFDPARSSCRCDVSGPAELGAVNPDAVHDHGQPACQRDDCFLHSAVPGNLHRPRLEP